MNNFKTKALLVGFGEMGKNYHLPTLISSSDINIVGIVRSTNIKTISKFSTFTSLEQGLQETKPDIVIIATPHYLHYSQTKLCLEYGCHLLVEKPLALNYIEAQHLVRLAEEKKKIIVIGLQRRYEGFAHVFRTLTNQGKLGNIKLIHGLFAHRFTSEEMAGWRNKSKLAGSGILDDSAFHLIDLLLYFSGARVKNLDARILNNGGKGMPHSFTSIFETTNGIAISACGSYLSPVNSVQEEISIWGTKGSLFARRFCKEWNTDPPSVFFKSSDGKQAEEFNLSNLPMGRTLPLQNLLNVLTGTSERKALLTEAKDTIETHKMIELLRKSIKE